ncbi:MAG TPA: response regulator, partial [Pseudolabrys sp.]|nr:response regulator [Pseudolabrys sp.]
TMGGEITVASRPGEGSVFTVKLLLSEVARPRIASTIEDRVRGYAGPRQTILVVDDNATQREVIVELLRPLGFSVLAAGDGADALAVVAHTTPDLSLIDVSMPQMDGWELGTRLRTALPERCAIVMLSALAPDKAHEVGPERIHDDYLMKPLNLRQLLEKIHALLDIEWVYASDGDTPMPDTALARSPLPPRADIEALIQLGLIGQLRGIEDKLSEIQRASPTFEAFVAQLAPMVEAVDLPRLVSALEALRSDDA